MIVNAEALVYRIDMDNKELIVNCNDLMCSHEGSKCTAKLPISEYSLYSLMRDGEKVYALGNQIFEISENNKTEIGNGKYGYFGNQVIFGNYIAYFDEQDVVVVEELETSQEVQRFEDITGFVQGNFYYKDCLYFITAEQQLVKLNLVTGEKEVVEEKGATRASVYKDYIYYIKVSKETDTNHLVKMDPITLEKEELIEGVFYYNMLDERIYYSTYPERQLWSSNMNGKDNIMIDETQEFGWLWTFENSNKILLDRAEMYTYYLLEENQEIDYENILMRKTGD